MYVGNNVYAQWNIMCTCITGFPCKYVSYYTYGEQGDCYPHDFLVTSNIHKHMY